MAAATRPAAIRPCWAATISPPTRQDLPPASTIASRPIRSSAWRSRAAAPTGAWRRGWAYLAGAFAFTNHWMSTDRFAFAGDHLTASFNAQSYGGRVEGGYRFATFFGG